MKKVICIADWAKDSYTNQEFQTAFEGFAKNPNDVRVTFVSSTPSTIHTGYILNQMVYTEERLGRPTETIIFQNTDPRIQTEGVVQSAEGAQFLIAHLASNIYVCGPNAGFDFSFIKPQIEELFIYPGIEKGTQFRSRDLFSRVIAHLADYMEQELELEEIHPSVIAALDHETFYIGHIDNYGNIKTTITVDDLKGIHEHDEIVKVTIGSVTKDARYVDNMFGSYPGELVIYPGSSGRVENPYLEVTVRRNFDKGELRTGMHEFQNPKPGDIIKIA